MPPGAVAPAPTPPQNGVIVAPPLPTVYTPPSYTPPTPLPKGAITMGTGHSGDRIAGCLPVPGGAGATGNGALQYYGDAWYSFQPIVSCGVSGTWQSPKPYSNKYEWFVGEFDVGWRIDPLATFETISGQHIVLGADNYLAGGPGADIGPVWDALSLAHQRNHEIEFFTVCFSYGWAGQSYAYFNGGRAEWYADLGVASASPPGPGSNPFGPRFPGPVTLPNGDTVYGYGVTLNKEAQRLAYEGDAGWGAWGADPDPHIDPVFEGGYNIDYFSQYGYTIPSYTLSSWTLGDPLVMQLGYPMHTFNGNFSVAYGWTYYGAVRVKFGTKSSDKTPVCARTAQPLPPRSSKDLIGSC